MGKKGANLDAIGFENKGTDPSLWVELAEGVDVGTYSSPDVDAIGAAYEEDDSPAAGWYAVLCVVVRGRSERDARDAMCRKVIDVAGALHGPDDDEDDDDGGDDGDDEPPQLPSGPDAVLDKFGRAVAAFSNPPVPAKVPRRRK